MIDRRKENEKNNKTKKNFSAFFIPHDRDRGRPVIVASPKVLGKTAKGETCNYIICAYKSSSSYAIIVDLMPGVMMMIYP